MKVVARGGGGMALMGVGRMCRDVERLAWDHHPTDGRTSGLFFTVFVFDCRALCSYLRGGACPGGSGVVPAVQGLS